MMKPPVKGEPRCVVAVKCHCGQAELFPDSLPGRFLVRWARGTFYLRCGG